MRRDIGTEIGGYKAKISYTANETLVELPELAATIFFGKDATVRAIRQKLGKRLKAVMRPDKVTRELYIGGVITQKIIKLHKFKSVINLSGDKVPYAAENLPLLDDIGNDPQQFIRIVKLINKRVKGKETPIYIHCGFGFSRSIVAVALYLYYTKTFTTFDEALEYVQMKRPEANPKPQLVKEVKEKVIPLLDRKK